MDQNNHKKTKLADPVRKLHFELTKKYAEERTKHRSTACDATKKNVEKEFEEAAMKTKSQGLFIPKLENSIGVDENRRFVKNNDMEGCIIDDNTPVTRVDCDKRMERVTSWVHTSKNLTVPNVDAHIPYFGEDAFEKDRRFVEKLENTVDEVDISEPIVLDDDDVFYDMVLSLGEAERLRAAAEQSDSEQKLTTAGSSKSDLVNLLGDLSVEKLKDKYKEGVVELPPEKIFETISSTFKEVASPSQLCTKFLKLCKSRKVKVTSAEFAMNVDGNTHVVQNRNNKTMNAFTGNFCRRCFMYNCPIHTENTVKIFPEYEKKKGPFLIPKAACSKDCFLNLPDFHILPAEHSENAIDEEGPESEAYKNNWSDGDSNMYSALAFVYPGNFCVISEILMKPCKLVYEHSRRGGKDLTKDIYGPVQVEEIKQAPKKKIVPVKVKRPAFEAAADAPYIPCFHPGISCMEEDYDCSCANSNTYCEKFCNCDENCKLRFPGCHCKTTCENGLCPCFAAGRECDPDSCEGCGAGRREDGTCKNVGIQRQTHKHLLKATSTIPGAGWGLFAKDDILKNEFIYEYTGEKISFEEADRRSKAYDKRCHTYLFELNNEFMIDAMLKGNKMRFANHSDNPNCTVKVMMVNGDHRIGVYAKQDIKAGEEIFLYYRKVLEVHESNKKRKRKKKKSPKNPSQTSVCKYSEPSC